MDLNKYFQTFIDYLIENNIPDDVNDEPLHGFRTYFIYSIHKEKFKRLSVHMNGRNFKLFFVGRSKFGEKIRKIKFNDLNEKNKERAINAIETHILSKM